MDHVLSLAELVPGFRHQERGSVEEVPGFRAFEGFLGFVRLGGVLRLRA